VDETIGAGRFQRVLVVSAHPDDPEMGFGALIARFVDEGADVCYVICTDGSQGGEDRAIPDAELTAIRYSEQRSAARLLGVREVVFLGFRDGQLTATMELRRAIAREIRRRRPELVMTHLPMRQPAVANSHPDHLAAGQATLAAVYPDACTARAYPELLSEGLAPHRVREVWVPGLEAADHYVDVSPTVDRQVRAILCHRSQFRRRERDPGAPARWAPERLAQVALVRQRLRQLGERSGLGCEYAARVRRLPVDEMRD